MPTTQKSQQKQTKATQKVGGSAKKPVTKAMEGGKGKVAVVKSKDTTRGGSARGGSFYNYEETKERSIKNQKLIGFLYQIIISLVEKLNGSLDGNNKHTFRIDKNMQFMQNQQKAYNYKPYDFEKEIKKSIDDSSYNFIEKIYIT